MNISFAQSLAWIASTAGSAESHQPVPAAASNALSEQQGIQKSGPPAASSVQFSTALRVDQKDQPYYEIIDDSTGNVLFEIPPQALREIGENLNLPLEGEASTPSVDLSS